MKTGNYKEIVSVEERFWSKVNKDTESGCWEWTAAQDGHGYGVIQTQKEEGVKQSVIKSHRLSWIMHNGNITDNLFVLHKCDNRKCVNPDHLFLGTNKDNMNDKVAKGRQKGGGHPKGYQYSLETIHKNRTWTIEQLNRVRTLYLQGATPKEIATVVPLNKSTITNMLTGNVGKRFPWPTLIDSE